MQSDNLTPRQLRAAERLFEDEGLTGDLTDDAARAVLHWASEVAVHTSGPVYSDEQADAAFGAIRRAVRQAARQVSDGDGDDVVALAKTALAQLAPELVAPLAPPPTPPTPPPEVHVQRLSPPPAHRRIAALRVRMISLTSHRVM